MKTVCVPTKQQHKVKNRHKFVSTVSYYNKVKGVMVINIPVNEQDNVLQFLGRKVIVEVRDPLLL
jgi:hypothetical protein